MSFSIGEIVFTCASLVTLCLTTLFSYRQFVEKRTLCKFLDTLNIDQEVSWNTAVQLSKCLRESFNVDQTTFTSLNMSKRPFLREDARYLVNSREGLCGEGARVLICLLNIMGFDATRVTLFTRWMHPSHTVVSVIVDGKEYLIDTLNSGEDFNSYLNGTCVSTADFNVMGHISDVDKRRMMKKKLKLASQGDSGIFGKYLFYSYDAIPFTKLFRAVGLNWRLINFRRPHQLISMVAEKPNLIMALVSFAISIVTTIMVIGIT